MSNVVKSTTYSPTYMSLTAYRLPLSFGAIVRIPTLLLFTIIFIESTMAQDFSELKLGSITPHYFSAGHFAFAHKTKQSQQVITNPLLAYKYSHYIGDKFEGIETFFGHDSIGSDIIGMGYSKGTRYSNFEFGISLGGYLSQTIHWRKSGISTFGLDLGNNYKFVPVVGISADLILLKMGKTTYLKMYNLFTPILSNHTIGIQWAF